MRLAPLAFGGARCGSGSSSPMSPSLESRIATGRSIGTFEQIVRILILARVNKRDLQTEELQSSLLQFLFAFGHPRPPLEIALIVAIQPKKRIGPRADRFHNQDFLSFQQE